MKFTSEDLMKAMGLQVGDKVKINGVDIFKIERNKYEEPFLKLEGNEIKSLGLKDIKSLTISCLVNMDFEILPRPKKLEDLMEKYKINDLVELEIALDYYEHRYDKVETRRMNNEN